ncbi:MAG: 50S ribosomal protein L11 methyltransferase [Clostridia bacterium]|nr:50S ribosomal protein L11 methyltransferase [Clostridia bacterium]
MDSWTEIRITVPVAYTDEAGAIAMMTVPYGIYTEDYSHLEQEAMEIAKIDLIDEALLKKDRTKSIVHIYISPENNPQEAVSFIECRLYAEKIPYTVALADCKDEDWQNNWRQYFQPMPIGEKLLIQPAWIPLTDAGQRRVLTIEPGLAFGTGNHETTRLCLQALENHITPQTQMLDVGCGSGILSVAAMLFGAKSALGVDIDPLAVKVAKDNGALNGFSEPALRFLQGNLTDHVSGKFNLVTANIVADAIIKLTPDIIPFMLPDAVYIVSGIIEPRAEEVSSALSENGFSVTAVHEENGWVCMESKRIGSV